jgi:DNA-binding NtrC family response regulator
VTVSLPSLRERRSDIVLLARALLERHRKRLSSKVEDLSVRTVTALESYHWPGNVRELENAILHGLIFGTARTMHPEDLPETVIKKSSADGRPARYYAAVDEAKRDVIRSAIDQANGNIRQAARDLGLNAGYLHRLMGNLGLKKST